MNPRTRSQQTTTAPTTSIARRRRHSRPAMIGAVSALALAGGVGAMVAPAAQAAASPAHSSHTTITLISTTKSNVRVPNGGVEVDVDKTTAGKVVGADSLVCHAAGKSVSCAVTIYLAKGALFFVAKPTKSGAAGHLVAGTGRYAKDTGGTVTATGMSATKTRVVIKLHS